MTHRLQWKCVEGQAATCDDSYDLVRCIGAVQCVHFQAPTQTAHIRANSRFPGRAEARKHVWLTSGTRAHSCDADSKREGQTQPPRNTEVIGLIRKIWKSKEGRQVLGWHGDSGGFSQSWQAVVVYHRSLIVTYSVFRRLIVQHSSSFKITNRCDSTSFQFVFSHWKRQSQPIRICSMFNIQDFKPMRFLCGWSYSQQNNKTSLCLSLVMIVAGKEK